MRYLSFLVKSIIGIFSLFVSLSFLISLSPVILPFPLHLDRFLRCLIGSLSVPIVPNFRTGSFILLDNLTLVDRGSMRRPLLFVLSGWFAAGKSWRSRTVFYESKIGFLKFRAVATRDVQDRISNYSMNLPLTIHRQLIPNCGVISHLHLHLYPALYPHLYLDNGEASRTAMTWIGGYSVMIKSKRLSGRILNVYVVK